MYTYIAVRYDCLTSYERTLYSDFSFSLASVRKSLVTAGAGGESPLGESPLAESALGESTLGLSFKASSIRSSRLHSQSKPH